MACKLHINLSLGLFEAEGDEEFVKSIYQDIKSSGLLVVPSTNSAEDSSEQLSNGNGAEKPKSKRATTKRTGPGCGTRIIELKDGGFFDELRDTKSISEGLAAKGHNYEGKHVAAALINLTKNGTLRRIKRDGNWVYQKP